MKTLVLVVWALAATAAAVFLVMRPVPRTGPSAPARDSSGAERRLAPDRSSAALEALLAISIPMPPKPEEVSGKTPVEQVEEIYGELRKQIAADPYSEQPRTRELERKIFALLSWDPDVHLALMAALRRAEGEDETDELLGFLVWNPWVRASRHGRVIESIEKDARDMLARDPDVHRRVAAVRVLYRYGNVDREDFDFGMERLAAEPDVSVRDVLLEEICVAGRKVALTREEAEPFVGHLRRRFEEGELWTAVAIADWSEDPEDFRRIRERLAVEKDQYRRQSLLNAFSGDHALVRGRADEARALLIEVLSDPAEHSTVRRLARSFLATTFGPMDDASAEAVSRYDTEQKGR